jgi:hypothetical protein
VCIWVSCSFSLRFILCTTQNPQSPQQSFLGSSPIPLTSLLFDCNSLQLSCWWGGGELCWIRGIVPSSTCNDFPLNCKTMAMIDLMRDWKSQLIAINSLKQKLVLGFPKNFSSTLVP